MIEAPRSDRIYLRPFTAADAPRLRCELADPRVLTGLPRCFSGVDGELERHHWVWNHTHHPGAAEEISRAICTVAGDQLVGCVGVDGATHELSYWIAGDFQRRGYAQEAVGRFLAHLAAGDARVAVHALVRRDNLASCRVLERLQFRLMGIETRAEGTHLDACVRYAWSHRP